MKNPNKTNKSRVNMLVLIRLGQYIKLNYYRMMAWLAWRTPWKSWFSFYVFAWLRDYKFAELNYLFKLLIWELKHQSSSDKSI